MKIISIGKHEKLYDEEGKARSFEKLGCKLTRIEEDDFKPEHIKRIVAEKPDFVLWAKLKIHKSTAKLLVTALRSNGITSVCWHPDLFIGLSREHRILTEPMWKADYIFSPDGGHDKYFKKYGINHHTVRQGIYDEDCYLGKQEKSPPIIFIGCHNPLFPYRQKLMKFIDDEFAGRFKWLGAFNTEEVRDEKLNNAIASADIIIGDSVHSPHYWSNRIYETLGRGGFLIHPRIEGLDKEYIPYKHFIPYEYGDFKSLKEKIVYFLNDSEKRTQISKEGMKYTIDNHTLVHRCQQILNILKK